MGLDYRHTCPEIDNDISTFITYINEHLEGMLEECCPLLSGEDKRDFIEGYSAAIYEDFQNSFESVRTCNENMRQEADNQIDSLEEAKGELEEELRVSNNIIQQLEEDNDDLEDEMEDLRMEMSKL